MLPPGTMPVEKVMAFDAPAQSGDEVSGKNDTVKF